MSKTLNLSPTGDRHSSNVSINQSDSFQIKQEMSFDDVSCGHVHKKFIDYRVMLMIKRPLYLKQMHEFLNANIEMGCNRHMELSNFFLPHQTHLCLIRTHTASISPVLLLHNCKLHLLIRVSYHTNMQLVMQLNHLSKRNLHNRF